MGARNEEFEEATTTRQEKEENNSEEKTMTEETRKRHDVRDHKGRFTTPFWKVGGNNRKKVKPSTESSEGEVFGNDS